MDKKILKEVAKHVWYYIVSYLTQFIIPLVKETAIHSKEYFINSLWSAIKEDFTANVESATMYIDKFFNSALYEEKEKEVINILFRNADLPFFLKPFRPLLKKVLKDKVHALVSKYLKKLSIKS